MVNHNSHVCPSCFTTGMGAGQICRNCGYDQQKEKKNPLRLPYFTRLKSRYLIGSLLGDGGFGITYKAWDMAENRICAIKEFVPLGVTARSGGLTLRPVSEERVREYEHGKERFIEEAQTLMRCDKIEQVVKIYESFAQNNTVYFSMEYLDGKNLRRLANARGGRMFYKEAWGYIRRAGNGLDELHRQYGIFHRDISPENIMVTEDGDVKLIDFGSAKYLFTVGYSELSIRIKPGYAPPEQYLKKGNQGCHTDVYALAGTFYSIVSGIQIPDAVARMAGGTYRRLKDLGLWIPPGVSDAVDAALELDYKQRTQTVAKFLDQVDEILEESVTESHNTITEEEGVIPVRITESKIQPYLLLSTANGRNRRYVLPSGAKIGVGRDEDRCMVQVNDGRISGLHLEVWYGAEEARFYICDHSLNGTFYRGQRLQKEITYQILPGEEITLSRQVCRLKLGTERAEE